jgi:ribosomal protein S18 acetylase RimI-like enzyme
MRGQNICAQWPNGESFTVGCGLRIRARTHAGPAIPLEPPQADGLASILSRAHHDEPHFRYMIPDERTRLRLLPGLFGVAIRACQLYGEVYTTLSIDGGALWIGPGTQLTLGRVMQTEFPSMPLQWDWSNLRRCMNVGLHLDEVHQRLINRLHWRLLALGVEPSTQKEQVGGKLIEPLLSRADSDGLPCYVETFNVRDLAFYKRHGFRIAGGGKIPRGGPDFWALIRAPRTG